MSNLYIIFSIFGDQNFRCYAKTGEKLSKQTENFKLTSHGQHDLLETT